MRLQAAHTANHKNKRELHLMRLLRADLVCQRTGSIMIECELFKKPFRPRGWCCNKDLRENTLISDNYVWVVKTWNSFAYAETPKSPGCPTNSRMDFSPGSKCKMLARACSCRGWKRNSSLKRERTPWRGIYFTNKTVIYKQSVTADACSGIERNPREGGGIRKSEGGKDFSAAEIKKQYVMHKPRGGGAGHCNLGTAR